MTAEDAKRYGTLGVVCAWLALTNVRLSSVESKLEDCQEKVITEIRNNVSKLNAAPVRLLAILPQPIKIEDENTTREI